MKLGIVCPIFSRLIIEAIQFTILNKSTSRYKGVIEGFTNEIIPSIGLAMLLIGNTKVKTSADLKLPLLQKKIYSIKVKFYIYHTASMLINNVRHKLTTTKLNFGLRINTELIGYQNLSLALQGFSAT